MGVENQKLLNSLLKSVIAFIIGFVGVVVVELPNALQNNELGQTVFDWKPVLVGAAVSGLTYLWRFLAPHVMPATPQPEPSASPVVMGPDGLPVRTAGSRRAGDIVKQKDQTAKADRYDPLEP